MGGVLGARTFLSCLRGSEPVAIFASGGLRFLSCLRGSELQTGWSQHAHGFLSCLRGSERLSRQHPRRLPISKLPTRQ